MAVFQAPGARMKIEVPKKISRTRRRLRDSSGDAYDPSALTTIVRPSRESFRAASSPAGAVRRGVLSPWAWRRAPERITRLLRDTALDLAFARTNHKRRE